MFGYDIFCNNLQCKKIFSELGGIRGINHPRYSLTHRGKARVMLHIGAGQSNNNQIILKLFGYDTFCNNLQYKKKFKVNLEVSEVLITYITDRGKTMLMLHIGAGHTTNCQIILKLFG